MFISLNFIFQIIFVSPTRIADEYKDHYDWAKSSVTYQIKRNLVGLVCSFVLFMTTDQLHAAIWLVNCVILIKYYINCQYICCLSISTHDNFREKKLTNKNLIGQLWKIDQKLTQLSLCLFKYLHLRQFSREISNTLQYDWINYFLFKS